MIHTIKGFSVVNEAEVDVFLEVPCFLHDSVNFGTLTSGSSAFSKPSLYIWNFSVHIVLKPNLKDFEHKLASMWNEYNCTLVWAFFNIALLWDWNENWPLPILWSLLSFPFFLTLMQHLAAATFTILKRSAGISSLPLALFIVVLPKAHLTSQARKSGSRWVTTTLWLSGSLRSFLYSSSVYSCTSF